MSNQINPLKWVQHVNGRRQMFVIFDFDGVVIDSFPAVQVAVANVYAYLNLDEPDRAQVTAWIGPSIEQSSESLQHEFGFDQPTRRRVADVYFESVVAESPKLAQLFPGIAELLNELNAASIPIALATMKTHAEMKAMDSPLPGLEFFEHVLAPETPSKELTKADLVREAVDALRNDLGATDHGYMVGDRASDIKAGRACGLQTIAVTWGAGTQGELNEVSPDRFVDTVQELRDALIGDEAHP